MTKKKLFEILKNIEVDPKISHQSYREIDSLLDEIETIIEKEYEEGEEKW
jgi:hypothetical protein